MMTGRIILFIKLKRRHCFLGILETETSDIIRSILWLCGVGLGAWAVRIVYKFKEPAVEKIRKSKSFEVLRV
jgi:hypothetical protein